MHKKAERDVAVLYYVQFVLLLNKTFTCCTAAVMSEISAALMLSI